MKQLHLAIMLMAFALCMGAYGEDQLIHNYIPKDGYVPDAKTAIGIADAVLSAIYGADNIQREKPLVAGLTDGVWTVKGTLSKGMSGGTALIEIVKTDGKILRVTHGR
jgi:hypothetical protein